MRNMINNYYKHLLVIFLATVTLPAFSEIETKRWSKQCDNKNKTSCIIAIKKDLESKKEDAKAQTIATVYLSIGTGKQKKMELVDKANQTYKLNENEINLPILFVNLPLNTDLRKKPLIQIDKKKVSDLEYLHCNAVEGCKAAVVVNEQVISLFKKGKELSVFFGITGRNTNGKIDFTLKGFSDAYDEL